MSYPRGYSIGDLESEIDKYGDESPNSHLGSSYYARASLGLTELERRSSNTLGWSTFVVSCLALIFSIVAVKYTAEQTKLTELQSRGERIQQLISINDSIELCKTDKTIKESGLFDVTTGKPATCEEVLRQHTPQPILGKLKEIFSF